MAQGFKATLSREVEDALMYLPRKGVSDFSRGDVIFDENNPSKALHLVVQGRVKVTIPVEDGGQTVVDIFNTDDFFRREFSFGRPSRAGARRRSG